ncbi:MAG: putative 2-dehydropantoate 2-reductase [Phormidesmis sp.]
MSHLRYAVIGTGAIGGYFGGRLSQSGCDVHFLLRSDYEQVRRNGLVVESVNGDFELPDVNAYKQSADMPPVDVVLVALKTTSNDRLADLLPPLKPDGVVVSLQNGWGVEAAIAQHLKAKKGIAPDIIGGLCFIYANKPGPGRIQHLGYGRLLLGAHNEQGQLHALTPRLKAIAEDFSTAAVEVEAIEDLPMARWRKLVWNVPYNSLSVILDATTGEMMADGKVRSLITTLMEEVIMVANAWGSHTSPEIERSISRTFTEQMLSLTATVSSYRTSMKIDYDAQRPLEIEAILGEPLRVAKSLGVAVPAMETIYQQLADCLRQAPLQSAASDRELFR